MKVLFCLNSLQIGGHIISSIALAHELQKNGHKVVFAAKRGPLYRTLKDYGITWHPVNFDYGYVNIFKLCFLALPSLFRIIEHENIQIVHSWEIQLGVLLRAPCIIYGIPSITTIAGGCLPELLPRKTEHLIVYSGELQDGILNKSNWQSNKVHVIPNRIDTNRFSPQHRSEELACKYNITLKNKNALIISRIEKRGGKLDSILSILSIVPQIIASFSDFRLFIAGTGSYFQVVEAEANSVNRQLEQNVVKVIGTVQDPSRFFPLFDLVFAMGRSALESMSCGVPTIIIGSQGYAGVASGNQLSDLSFYNFSGRNIKRPISMDIVIQSILEILKDPTAARGLGVSGRKYIIDNYDVVKGAVNLSTLYNTMIDKNKKNTISNKARQSISWINSILAIPYFLIARRLSLINKPFILP